MTKRKQNIWQLVKEGFDEKLPRRMAVLVKEEDFSLPFAYPTDFGSIGWFLDNRRETTYDQEPVAAMKFGEYFFDQSRDLLLSNTFYFSRMEYFPSLVKRQIVFSNIGIEIEEKFAQNRPSGFSWAMELSCCSHPSYTFKGRFFAVVILKNTAAVKSRGRENVLRIEVDGKELYLASQFSSYGVYKTADAYLKDLKKGRVSGKAGQGRYVVLEFTVELASSEKTTITFGISFRSADRAVSASRPKRIEQKLSRDWNKWFTSLPTVNFESQKEKKAYYKCWWVIKLNYYRHPQWGKTVIEALPVYRGYWQWGLPPMEWHGTRNPEIGPGFVRTILDKFLKYQKSDGYVTHAIYIDEKVPGQTWARSRIIQTPHIPWVALRYYRVTGDISSLKGWYPKIVRYYDWLNRARDNSFMNLHLWGCVSSYDTGLDTTGVLQKVTYGENGVRERFCYPAIFAAERCRFEQALAAMADILKNGQGKKWCQEAAATRGAMDKILWDKKRMWYGALHEDGTLDTRLGVDGLFPFAYGLVKKSKARAAKGNFSKLLAKYGVFTMAPDEPGFYGGTYWRGPVWAKSCSVAMATAVNYYPALKKKIKQSLIEFLLRYPSVWECMNASTGKIARGDQGQMAAPVISSNVGAGEAIGAILMYHGDNVFSIDKV